MPVGPISELEKIDWDFRTHRQCGIDSLHWFPASFISQIPAILIAHLSDSGHVVADPFCGSGSVLVESVKLGRNGIGIDHNPLAYMITKAKVTYLEPRYCQETFQRLKKSLSEEATLPLIPSFPDRDRWFHPNTLRELGRIFYLVSTEPDSDMRNFLAVCFSAILKKCCTQRDHYTYVADNMFPKAGEALTYINAVSVYLQYLANALKSLEAFYREIQIQGEDPRIMLSRCQVFREDARQLKSIARDTVDLIVTSPPYANVTDYTKGNRLSFYWLQLGDFFELQKEEIGARWKRGRASALEDYLSDVEVCFDKIWQTMKKSAYLCLVLGQTSSVNNRRDLHREALTILEGKIGFTLLSGSISRNIYGKRIRAVRGVEREHIYILQKQK
jgi:DNA modification methylase